MRKSAGVSVWPCQAVAYYAADLHEPNLPAVPDRAIGVIRTERRQALIETEHHRFGCALICLYEQRRCVNLNRLTSAGGAWVENEKHRGFVARATRMRQVRCAACFPFREG